MQRFNQTITYVKLNAAFEPKYNLRQIKSSVYLNQTITYVKLNVALNKTIILTSN